MLKNNHQNKQIPKAEKQINHQKKKASELNWLLTSCCQAQFPQQGHPPASGGTGVTSPACCTTGAFCIYSKSSAFLHPRRWGTSPHSIPSEAQPSKTGNTVKFCWWWWSQAQCRARGKGRLGRWQGCPPGHCGRLSVSWVGGGPGKQPARTWGSCVVPSMWLAPPWREPFPLALKPIHEGAPGPCQFCTPKMLAGRLSFPTTSCHCRSPRLSLALGQGPGAAWWML